MVSKFSRYKIFWHVVFTMPKENIQTVLSMAYKWNQTDESNHCQQKISADENAAVATLPMCPANTTSDMGKSISTNHRLPENKEKSPEKVHDRKYSNKSSLLGQEELLQTNKLATPSKVLSAAKQSLVVCTCCHKSLPRQLCVIFKQKNYDYSNSVVTEALHVDIRYKHVGMQEFICKTCHRCLRKHNHSALQPKMPSESIAYQ